MLRRNWEHEKYGFVSLHVILILFSHQIRFWYLLNHSALQRYQCQKLRRRLLVEGHVAMCVVTWDASYRAATISIEATPPQL